MSIATIATRTNGRPGHHVETNRIAPGESSLDRQRGAGHFLALVAQAGDRNAPPRTQTEAVELLDKQYGSRRGENRTLVANVGSAGGFAVPQVFAADWIQQAAELAIVRPRATVLTQTTVDALVPTVDEGTAPTTAGNTTAFGGMNMQWQALDETTIPAVDPAFSQTHLSAKLLTGAVNVSRPLLRFSPAIAGGLIAKLMGEAVAYAEDYAFLRGHTALQPQGIVGAPGLIKTGARAASGTILFSDVRLMLAKLLPASRPRAVFVISQNALDDLEAATAEAASVFGRIKSHAVVLTDPVTGEQRIKEVRFLSGCELLTSEKLPALDTSGDFLLCDLSRYLISDCIYMEVSLSQDAAFLSNQVVYRLVHMVAGMPWNSGPITLPDTSTTTSPFVALGV